MDEPRNCHTKGKKSEKDNAIQHPLYVESKTKYNELMYEAKTGSNTENKLRVTKWKGG